ncbi:Short chain fatty acid transporter [Indibacter alkaliphilus LW1]|jgi:short-chain fatty acids transporter|uniref:Short chain fatty acid transporter n=1 Tax=Indibacter alkaliphilus (strain CCUG 57479 / KCTC 22604 / LW1) TaxID=1189612 RepID=S2D9Z9_INDAL|nr:TIGR00366 family protein [Indibacter alkaliphilus]EOZ95744.1 Short chain fatty acid transporter [Indibacter alkaliphilus LW1]
MKINLNFPSSFQIALLLSLIVYVLAVGFTLPTNESIFLYSFQVLKFWKSGFWELLEFTLQMILILVFGHTLAMSQPVDNFLDKVAFYVKTNTHAVLFTGGVSMAGGYLNWGFGLILGAVLARKIGEIATEKRLAVNYPLVAASGYLGMLVWHGGLSGSSTLKVAEENHFLMDKIGVVTINKTIFSDFNIWTNVVLILCLILLLLFLSKKPIDKQVEVTKNRSTKVVNESKDKLGYLIGLIILALSVSEFSKVYEEGWGFLDLNFVNFILLGLGLLAFGSLSRYVSSLSEAVRGATDILIQFPFYAGILGIMKYSGLLVLIADGIVQHSGPGSFPLFSFFSAAIINFFVPSGGGQWAIQGPVIVEAANQMNISVPNMIIAFAYGDQVSNMLQPFWALPLLAITGLSAKSLLGYTFYFFLIALLIFGISIWLFV